MSLVVRPSRSSDHERLSAMIDSVDPGMLTMPSTPEAMARRVAQSTEAFARPSHAPEGEAYFLVMEEADALVGTASIFTNLGVDRPFYSYRISRDSKVSPETGVKVELDLLHLVNDHHGDAELGTLFLMPGSRGGGRGKLLSYARLLLIAVDPVRFGPKVMAEIRGWTDDAGRSPFWEAVGRKFFRMDYRVADAKSARDHRFIADLMPRYPIYADLLPDDARAVIAKPHRDAEAAVVMLKAQGFRYHQVVDIFDAGPCVECFTDQIDIVRSSERMSAREAAGGDESRAALMAMASLERFAATLARAGEPRAAALDRIGAQPSDEVLVYRQREGRK
ncbi:arginine N-succinyltransferase [bacterium]|nr:arginine N-succinyltransferase [bacterium]